MKHVFKKDSIGIPGGGLKYFLNVHPRRFGFMVQFDGCILRTKPPARDNLQPIIFAHETNAIRDIAGYHWYSFWRIKSTKPKLNPLSGGGSDDSPFPFRGSHMARAWRLLLVVAREW